MANSIFDDLRSQVNSLDVMSNEFSFMDQPSVSEAPGTVASSAPEQKDDIFSTLRQRVESPGASTYSFMDQPSGPAPPEKVDRGFFMDLGTGLVAGVADLAEQYARAVRHGDVKPSQDISWVDNIASWVINNKASFEEDHPYIFQDTKSDSQIRDRISQALHGGARGAVQSLGTMVPGVVLGAVVGGGLPGAVVGGATSGGVAFGLAEYDKFADDIYRYNLKNPDKAISDEKWKPYALASAIQEAGLEFASDIVELATFKIGKLAVAPFKESVDSLLKLGWKGGAKDFLKKITATELAEVPTEMGQNYFENYLRSKAGLPQDQTPFESALDAIGPTIVSTLLIGGVFHTHNARTRGRIYDALVDNTVDPATRVDAAAAVYTELQKVDKQMGTDLATKWDGLAAYYIKNGEAIPVDKSLLDMKDAAGLTQEKLVQQQLDADIKLFEDRGFSKEEAEKKAKEFDEQQIAAENEERRLHDENHPAAQRLFAVEMFNTLQQTFIDKGFSPERSVDLAKMIMGAREEVKAEETIMQPSIILGSDGIPMLKPIPQETPSGTQEQLGIQDTIVKLPAVLKTSAIQNPLGNPFGSKGAATVYLKAKGLGETHQPFQLGERSWVGLPNTLVQTVNTLLRSTRPQPNRISTPAEITANMVDKNIQQQYRGVARPGDVFASGGRPFTSEGVVKTVLKRMAAKNPEILQKYVPFPLAKSNDNKSTLWVARHVDQLDEDQRDVYAAHLEGKKEEITEVKKEEQPTTKPEVQTWVEEQEQRPIQPGEITVAQPVTPVEPETIEHRANLALRENIDKLTPEQKDQVIADLREQVLLNPLTKLRNRLAYMMDPRLKAQATIDLDGLKWINDTLGHPVGDQFIQHIGDVLRTLFTSAYHFGGDEFVIQHNSKTALSLGLKAAQKALKKVTVTVTAADGKIYTKKGVDFSYGVGRSMEEAENALQEHKRFRTVKGLRAERGGQPPNVVTVTPSPVEGGVTQPASSGVGQIEGTEKQPPPVKKGIPPKLKELKEKIVRATAKGLIQQLESGVAVDPKLVAKFPSIAKVWQQDATGKWTKTELPYKKKLSELEKENKKEARNITKAIEKAKKKEAGKPKPKIEEHPDFLSKERYDAVEEQFLLDVPGKGLVPKTARNPFEILQSLQAMFNAKLQGKEVSVERAANFLNQIATAYDTGDLNTHFESSEEHAQFQNSLDTLIDFADKVIKLTAAGKFAKIGKVNGALTVEQVQSVVDRIVSKWGISQVDIQVVDNYNDERVPLVLRANIAEASGEVAAAFQDYENDKPDIFLFADKIATPHEAAGYLLHEAIGHFGFSRAFGHLGGATGIGADNILRQIWTKYKDSEMMKRIILGYPEHNAKGWFGQMSLAEEFLAYNAEQLMHEDRTLWSRIKDFVDHKLREWGFKETTSDDFIRDILMKSARGARADSLQQEASKFAKTLNGIIGPVHGTFIDNLDDILTNGLRPGSALDYTSSRDWANEYEAIVEVPTAKQGTYVAHNNYYTSVNNAKVTKVIVDLDVFTDRGAEIVKEQLTNLKSKHPDVKFVILNDLVANDQALTLANLTKFYKDKYNLSDTEALETAKFDFELGFDDPERRKIKTIKDFAEYTDNLIHEGYIAEWERLLNTGKSESDPRYVTDQNKALNQLYAQGKITSVDDVITFYEPSGSLEKPKFAKNLVLQNTLNQKAKEFYEVVTTTDKYSSVKWILSDGTMLGSTDEDFQHFEVLEILPQNVKDILSEPNINPITAPIGYFIQATDAIRVGAGGGESFTQETPLLIMTHGDIITSGQFTAIKKLLPYTNGTIEFDKLLSFNYSDGNLSGTSGVAKNVNELMRKIKEVGGPNRSTFAKALDAVESTDIPPNPNMGPQELNKLKALLKQEGTIMLRTLAAQRPSRLPKLTAMERLLRSPEWYNHPLLKQIVDFAIARHDRYYELFNRFNSIPGQKDTIIDKTVALRGKGLTLAQRLKGETSPEYKLLSKVITQLDTGAWREGLPEDSKLTYLEYLKQQNVPQEVIDVFQLHRAAYDRVLDELIKSTTEIVTAIETDAKERGVKPQYPSLPTVDDKGQVTSVSLRDVLDHMNSLRGTYAPRLREKGGWEILADKKGEDRLRIHKSLRLDAERVKYQLEKEGWDVKLSERELLPEDVYSTLRIVNTAHAIEVAMNKATKGTDPELAKKFNEQILQNVADLIRMRGFRSLMIKRRLDTHVGGYIEDPNERFIAYMNNVSAGIAKGEAARNMFRVLSGYYTGEGKDRVKVPGIDPAKDRRAYQVATDYITEQLRNADAADRVVGYIKSVATLKYLGFNPHAPVVNVVALGTTVPLAIQQYVMGGKGSLTKIGAAITKASKDYAAVMRGKALTNTDEQAFMDEIKSRGYDDPAYTRDAQGTIQRLHGKIWTSVMNNAMYVFGKSEQWIRGTTMLAAYRIAKQQGATDDVAKTLAHDASNKAHGIYGKATLPSWAQGTGLAAKIFQVLYTYQKFPHNYLQMLYDVGVSKRNVKGFLFGILSPVFLGGAAVWPFKDLFLGIITGILKLLGIRVDPEKWFWDKFRKNFGSTSERVARHGIFGAANLDLSGSLSIGVGIPKTIPEMFGVAGGLASDISQAGSYLGMGQYGRAAEKTLPNAFGNLFRAWREINSGVTTSTGQRVWNSDGKPYMPSEIATVLRATGFRTAEQAMTQARAWETKREIQSYKDKRDKITQQYRYYLEDPKRTPDDLKRIMDQVKAYNDSVMLNDRSGVIPVIKQQTLKSVAKTVFVPKKNIYVDLERNK